MSALWTLIPVKSFREAKQRLAPVLDAAEREALSVRMLAQTLRTVRKAVGDQPVMVVAADPEVVLFARSLGADNVYVAPVTGLNEELSHAAAAVPHEAALLVVHADLPGLQAGDIHALLSTTAPVAIAPDYAGTGTNALLQRQPDRFFAFGADSCARHLELARERGLTVERIDNPGLSDDLDSADDWSRLMQAMPRD
jgi:2-phospho-L-lactate guanylyltransferase